MTRSTNDETTVSDRDLWITWVLVLATPNVLALLFLATVRGWWWCLP